MSEVRAVERLYFAPLRWLAAWMLYGAAILWEITLGRVGDDHGIGWRLFQIVQWLFSASSDVQGETAFGPWSATSPHKED